jgi:hypothetical protein
MTHHGHHPSHCESNGYDYIYSYIPPNPKFTCSQDHENNGQKNRQFRHPIIENKLNIYQDISVATQAGMIV